MKKQPDMPIISAFCLVLLLVGVTFLLQGCSSLVDKATEPGRDERCVVGLGMEFCYYRERTEDAGTSRTDTADQ